jgi:hypothetical protein
MSEILTTSDSAFIAVVGQRVAVDSASLSDMATVANIREVPTTSFATVTTTRAERIVTETFI